MFHSSKHSLDYSPFGVALYGRNWSSEKYRCGFQGQEKDDEVKGSGNSYTTEFRQYDPRLGRWLSLDPAMAKYPGQSPYVAFNNNPIYYTDPRGDDPPEKVFQDNANKISKGAVFGTPNFSSTFKSGVLAVGHNEKYKTKFFQYHGTQKPSDVLDKYTNLVISGSTPIDCGMYAALVYAVSFKELYGNEKFDKLFYNEETKDYSLYFDQIGFSFPSLDDMNSIEYFDNTMEKQGDAFSVADKTDVGTILTFKAVDASKAKSAYVNENFIKVGDNQYAAFPLTKDNAYFLTLEQLQNQLPKYGSKDDNDRTTYFLSSISETVLPLD